MKRHAWWLVLACVATMGLAACGDDDDDDGSSGSGSSGSGSSGNNAGSSATGSAGMGGDNVFADYDCGDTSANGTCDQAICALEMAYDQIQTSCTGSGAGQGICDNIAMCIRNLADCFGPACPSGSTATQAALTCVQTYTTCAFSATGSQ